MRYATDAAIAKFNKKIHQFKQGSLTPWDFSQTVWDLVLRCGGVYTSRFCEEISSRALTTISAILCKVDGRIFEKLCCKNWPTRPTSYWIYIADIRKPPRGIVNGSKLCLAAPKDPGEEAKHAALRQFKTTIRRRCQTKRLFVTKIVVTSSGSCLVGTMEEGVQVRPLLHGQ